MAHSFTSSWQVGCMRIQVLKEVFKRITIEMSDLFGSCIRHIDSLKNSNYLLENSCVIC